MAGGGGGVKVWPGPGVGVAWDVGNSLDSFILVLWAGKLRL